MSWLTKVSHIAGRAEDLLNQIDQNAAVALRNTRKGKSDSAVSLIDNEGQGTKKLEKPQSGIVEAATMHQISTSKGTYGFVSFNDSLVVSVSYHFVKPNLQQKKDDELIAYLNNSNEPTSSRCSSVASCFSAANSHLANVNQTTPEAYTSEEYLKTQYSDTVKCLDIKESQIAVLSVRLQEAEEVKIKKNAQIAELTKELKLIKKELEAKNGNIVNDQSFSLKKLQREHDREKEEFKKREESYVKRLKSANNENSENEKELQKLRTKILKMEVNEQNLMEEMRLAKCNLETNKHEFDEYKQRAQKILSAKENLLASLKENSSIGSESVINSVELEELRCELDLLKDDLQQSQFVIYNLKGDIQEMENRLRDEQRASGAQRENLLNQIHHHLSQANQYREQMERTQLEYDFLQAEMRRQEEAIERKLAEKDIELAKLMEEKKTSKRYEIGEMEQKISLLSEKLISKQTAIERIESEKRALELRLKHTEYACRSAETAAVKAVTIEMRGSGVNVSGQSSSSLTISHADNMLIRTAKLAVCTFDHLGLRLAVFMRSPMFRFFFFMYFLLLHTWLNLDDCHDKIAFVTEDQRTNRISKIRIEGKNVVAFLGLRYIEDQAILAIVDRNQRLNWLPHCFHARFVAGALGLMDSVVPIPQSLRPIAHYVKIGAENAGRDPIIHYWCLFYAVQSGMDIDKKSPEALQYLTSLLSILEDMKKKLDGQEALTQDLVAQAHIENFAVKLFDYADKNDRQSNFTKGVIKAFYVAGHLIDVLTLFGELDENLIATRKYAKWKAAYIHSCMKNGETPKPGSSGGQVGDLKDFDMTIPQTETREEPQSTASGPVQPSILPNPVACSHTVLDSAPVVETYETLHIPDTMRTSQEVSENSNSGRLTLDDYMEAQKYAKYAVSALSYEDSKTAIESMLKALAILKK
ncbi:hypothetical protein LOAG_18006 [Loa loa]|uniref:Uncharacterized protein n=1 Tax=Loa loa TaxID=7209 RepID=A0A1S0UH04_LOALO|nr:hypothetical protein LOAG_18006 [Loa loa]EJD74716.1 hypothetical protein LOAG_18006 [Loa loa]